MEALSKPVVIPVQGNIDMSANEEQVHDNKENDEVDDPSDEEGSDDDDDFFGFREGMEPDINDDEIAPAAEDIEQDDDEGEEAPFQDIAENDIPEAGAHPDEDLNTPDGDEDTPLTATPHDRYMTEKIGEIKKQVKQKFGPIYDGLKSGDCWVRAPDPMHALRTSVYKKSGPVTPDWFYYRDIFVWIPHITYPQLRLDAMQCPKCLEEGKTGAAARGLSRGGWANTCRRIIGEEENFYLYTMRYKCSHNHRFQPTLPAFVNLLPIEVQLNFPVALSHRSGLAMSIQRKLNCYNDMAVAPQSIANMLLEAHATRWQHQKLKYLALAKEFTTNPFVKRRILNDVHANIPEFSDFDDPAGYNGFTPSGIQSNIIV
jgi:hypothetical protein